MSRLKKENLLALLALSFFVWAVLATVYAVKLNHDLRGRAFFGFGKDRFPSLGNVKKRPEWQTYLGSAQFLAFTGSPQFRGLAKSGEWNNLRESPAWQNLAASSALQNLLQSPALAALGQSPSLTVLKQSAEAGRVKTNFSRYGTMGGTYPIKNFLGSSALKNFLGSAETKAFLQSSEIKAFLASPELKAFVQSPEFRAFFGSVQFQGTLQSPFFKGALGILLGNGVVSKPFGELLEGLDLTQLGLESLLVDLLKPLLSSLLGINWDDFTRPAWSTEVLREDGEGNPTLVRFWGAWDVEGSIWNDLGIGLYIYLVKGDEGIVVWDSGMKYAMATTFGPLLNLLNLDLLLGLLTGSTDLCTLFREMQKMPCDDPSLLTIVPNSEKVIEAVKKYFPGQKIREVDIPHWHIDHAQDGPRLQEMAEKEFGYRPPLRVHIKDKYWPDEDGSPGGTDQLFADTCYPPGSWTWGADLVDGEYLPGTTYRVLHTSGHTFGTVSIVSDEDKIGIHDGFPPSFGVYGAAASTVSEPRISSSACNPIFDQILNFAMDYLGALGEASGECTNAFPLEDPEGAAIGGPKYIEAAPAKGYPTYWLHFPLVTSPEEYLHPPEPTPDSPTLTPTPIPSPTPTAGGTGGWWKWWKK